MRVGLMKGVIKSLFITIFDYIINTLLTIIISQFYHLFTFFVIYYILKQPYLHYSNEFVLLLKTVVLIKVIFQLEWLIICQCLTFFSYFNYFLLISLILLRFFPFYEDILLLFLLIVIIFLSLFLSRFFVLIFDYF